LLKVVEARRAQIHALLVDTKALATQLIGLVADNKATLDPALARLRTVTGILQKNQNNLDKSLQVLAPFVRDFANTLGNGRWFDTVIFNLPPANLQVPCPGSVQPAPASKPARQPTQDASCP
jgi:phospholipid/cholesterol/gamma-HCH transport system substrate-binding protein